MPSSNKNPIPFILTVDKVKEFHDTAGSLRLNGYQIATEEISMRIRHMLENSSDSFALKKELENFVADRENFTNFLSHKADDHSERYNL